MWRDRCHKLQVSAVEFPAHQQPLATGTLRPSAHPAAVPFLPILLTITPPLQTYAHIKREDLSDLQKAKGCIWLFTGNPMELRSVNVVPRYYAAIRVKPHNNYANPDLKIVTPVTFTWILVFPCLWVFKFANVVNKFLTIKWLSSSFYRTLERFVARAVDQPVRWVLKFHRWWQWVFPDLQFSSLLADEPGQCCHWSVQFELSAAIRWRVPRSVAKQPSQLPWRRDVQMMIEALRLSSQAIHRPINK